MAIDPASSRPAASAAEFSGAAKSGTEECWHMRVTVVALVPLAVGFVILFVSLVGKDYAEARAVLGRPLSSLVMLLFILAGVYHMKLGMQAIIDDYIHSPGTKGRALVANLLFSVGIGLVCLYAALKLGFT
jgi:succinate dehydrogenase / fumarate reductase membrane anchor subunit